MNILVFNMNDVEWCAGECTKEEIVDWYCETTGCSKEDYIGDNPEGPQILTDVQLEQHMMHDEDTGKTMSFRIYLENLIAEGIKFPMYFAADV